MFLKIATIHFVFFYVTIIESNLANINKRICFVLHFWHKRFITVGLILKYTIFGHKICFTLSRILKRLSSAIVVLFMTFAFYRLLFDILYRISVQRYNFNVYFSVINLDKHSWIWNWINERVGALKNKKKKNKMNFILMFYSQ